MSGSLSLKPSLSGRSEVKLIGVGGVGGIVARYVGIFLASRTEPSRLVLVDGDRFEPDNASRMLYREEGNKAEVLRDELRPHFRHAAMMLIAIPDYVTPDNLDRLVRDGDTVLLCVDNHATRKLVSDHCANLTDVCLISGGNDGVGEGPGGVTLDGTYGNVQVFLRRQGEDVTPSLDTFHAEIREPPDRSPADASCTELVESQPQLLFANLLTASAICNTLFLYLCDRLHYGEAHFDLARCEMKPSPVGAPAGEHDRSVARGP